MHHRLVGTVILAATPALATDWVGGVGNWTDAANWSGGIVPASGIPIIINNGGTALATNLTLAQSSGVLGASLGEVSGNGALIQSGGSSSWTALGFWLGVHVGTTGSLTLTNAATLTSPTLRIGARGHGTALIEAGSTVNTTQLSVAGINRTNDREFTASGTMTVTGTQTRVFVTNTTLPASLTVGLNGSGSLNIADGTVVETNNALLVSTTAAGSSITIDHATLRFGGHGPNSWFDLGRDITLPDTHPAVGNAVLTLRKGLVEDDGNTRGMFLAPQSLIQGTGELRTSITNIQASVIDPGENNTHGHLTVSRLLDNNGAGPNSTGGTLRFDITSTELHDHLTVGALLAGGTLEIVLSDTFSAAYGDTFELITITNQSTFLTGDDVMGVFDTTILPDLTGPLFFELGYSNTAITLTVVPTPATLIALTLTPLLRRRRQAI